MSQGEENLQRRLKNNSQCDDTEARCDFINGEKTVIPMLLRGVGDEDFHVAMHLVMGAPW